MTYACVPPVVLGFEDGHIPTFWLLLAGFLLRGSGVSLGTPTPNLKGPEYRNMESIEFFVRDRKYGLG